MNGPRLRHPENPLYSLVKIASLAVGFAAAILLFGYLRFELMFDRWVPDSERIYTFRVLGEASSAGGNRYHYIASPSGALELPDHLPAVEAVTLLGESSLHFLKEGSIQDLEVRSAPPDFFDLFPVSVRAGDPKLALSEPDSVVLTEAAAQRLLGPGEPVGKMLTTSSGDRFRVGAVVKAFPDQTHFDADILTPSAVALDGRRDWTWEGGQQIYIKLAEGVSADQLRPEILTFTRTRMGAPNASAESGEASLDIVMCPLVRLHIADNVFCTSYEKTPVDPQRLYALGAIVAGILILATLNFANIALARSLRRSREAALRKVVGASRLDLMRQYLGESVILAVLSLLVGLALAAMLREPFAALVGQGDSRAVLDGAVMAAAALLAGLAGVLGGFYPALVASRQQPALIFGGVGDSRRGATLQTVLVAFQFTLAVGLTVAAIVILQQDRHIRATGFGYDAEGVVVVRSGAGNADALRMMEERLQGHPAIRGIARANGGPGIYGQSFMKVGAPERPEPIDIISHTVGADFFAIFRLETSRAAGAPPLEETWSGPVAMVNEASLPSLGFSTAGDAIGEWLTATQQDGATQTLRIVGVASDYGGPRAQPEPKIFTPVPSDAGPGFLAARLAAGRESQGMAALDRVWRERVPDEPIDRYFVAQAQAYLYDAQRRTALSFGIAAGLALILAAIGLFGQSALAVERRTHEMAVRKVHGARLSGIVGLVIWQILKPALPAMLLAWAISWHFLQGWLDGFVIRIDLSPAPFAIAGLGAVFIGGLAVIGHAWRAGSLHPADVLRIE